MDALLVGIASHFSQQYQGSYTDFYNAISGRLREGVPRPEDSDIYVTVNFPTDVDDSQMDNDVTDVVVQFDIYSHSTSSATIGDAYTKLRSWFDDCEDVNGNWAALAVTGYRVQLVDWFAANKFPPDLAADGEDAYWRYSVRYLVKLYKTS